jgi:hypothetical protein
VDTRGNEKQPAMWIGVVPPKQSRLPKWISSFMASLVTAAATAVATSWLLLALTPSFQDALAQPQCDDPRGLHIVKAENAKSSGFLTEEIPIDTKDPNGPKTTLEHVPKLAIDGDLGTSWVENGNAYGVNETLTLKMPKSTKVKLICIVNGYTKSLDLYLKNARVRQLEVLTDSGTKIVTLRQKADNEFATYQELNVAKGPTDEIRMKILVGVGGTGADRAADTSISEVEVWAGD